MAKKDDDAASKESVSGSDNLMARIDKAVSDNPSPEYSFDPSKEAPKSEEKHATPFHTAITDGLGDVDPGVIIRLIPFAVLLVKLHNEPQLRGRIPDLLATVDILPEDDEYNLVIGALGNLTPEMVRHLETPR